MKERIFEQILIKQKQVAKSPGLPHDVWQFIEIDVGLLVKERYELKNILMQVLKTPNQDPGIVFRIKEVLGFEN